MRTEDYIILMPAVNVEQRQVVINYASNAPDSSVYVVIKANNGRTIKTFNYVKGIPKGQLTFSTEGLLPGTYTCSIYLDGKVIESKKFSVA